MLNLVFCYHALSERWHAPLSVRPERFAGQVETMLARGYRPVTFSELTRAPHDAGLFAITFDDAFRSVHKLAVPVLRRLSVPATVFVPTGPVEAGRPLAWEGTSEWLETPWASELTPMSWVQLRELAAAGWEIGSHTVSHPHLPRLGDEELAAQLSESKTLCEERLERPCTSLAYPYGDVAPRVIAAARAAGYATAAGLPGDFGRHDPLLWPRIGVYHRDDERRFRLKISATMHRLRSNRRVWELAVGRGRQLAPALPARRR
ncbi:MAG TPA: polysaccharide deacetylase family protein [Solirubrobacteraceae bacterium]|nr:polysaccharide deacetylase family protein [Solirubrobacteraceae bacterium]